MTFFLTQHYLWKISKLTEICNSFFLMAAFYSIVWMLWIFSKSFNFCFGCVYLCSCVHMFHVFHVYLCSDKKCCRTCPLWLSANSFLFLRYRFPGVWLTGQKYLHHYMVNCNRYLKFGIFKKSLNNPHLYGFMRMLTSSYLYQ